MVGKHRCPPIEPSGPTPPGKDWPPAGTECCAASGNRRREAYTGSTQAVVRAPIDDSPVEADVISLTEGSTDALRGPTVYGRSGEDNNRRKPTSQFVREGESQLRFAERAFPGQ
jgi:hypothetical protein